MTFPFKVFITFFMLGMAGFSAMVVHTARNAYIDKIEKLCEQPKRKRNEFGHYPKEKTDVRNTAACSP